MFWSILLSIEYQIRTIHIPYITIYPISLTFQFVWQEQDFVDVLTGEAKPSFGEQKFQAAENPLRQVSFSSLLAYSSLIDY